MEADERKRREQEYAQTMAFETLCAEEMALWKERSSVQRMAVSAGTIYILWKLHAGNRPEVKDAFEVKDIEIGKEGLAVWVESKRFSGLGYKIGHAPSTLAGDQEVFVWIPFFTLLSYVPHPQGRNWLVRAEMCVRSKSHPRRGMTVGHTYLTHVGEFRAHFRDFAEVRF